MRLLYLEPRNMMAARLRFIALAWTTLRSCTIADWRIL
jgi:hypothetical protein